MYEILYPHIIKSAPPSLFVFLLLVPSGFQKGFNFYNEVINMYHSFDKDIAVKYGLAEAIILNHMQFWIEKNKANGANFFDGFYWTYNSARAYAEIFPYFSQRQIQNALKHLKDEEILQTGNYNAVAYDRTTWYAFTEKGESIMQKCKMDYAETETSIMQKCKMDYANLSNRLCKNVEPIPSNNQYIKPVNKTSKKKSFEDLIKGYTENENLKSAINDFIEFRKQIKAPLTEKALTLSFNKLDKLAGADIELKISIINQSIERGWKGLFEYKDNAPRSSAPASEYDVQDLSTFWNQ